ncbi:MAG: hypothetical protein JXA73_18640 [Acidobacteria bacterium]|nr:hypothetical protein [Acidobacteriota bacterium]
MEKAKTNSKQFSPEKISRKEEFALVMTDPRAFKRAVSIKLLNKLIPELNAFEEDLPETDPNIYRPMPLMEHTFESIRHAFEWIQSFGAEEYQGNETKCNSMKWINTALLFHDLGEVAIIKGTNLPIWYDLAVEWSKNKERNASILKETYPFFGLESPEARNYIGHLMHPEISALLADDFLSSLGWDSREIKIVQFLIRNQSVLIEKATYGRIKDGRTLHEDFYKDIDSIEKETGICKEDLLKMLQVLQIADANAVRADMARIPQETLIRVWMAYDYMSLVLMVRSSPARYKAFMNYREAFGRIRRGKSFGTPFEELFDELLRQIEKENGILDENEKRMLEQHLEYFEKFRIIKEDHIHINDHFNQLLRLVERTSGKQLSAEDMALLLKGYKVAYRSHDGHSRRQLKIVPVGDVRRKFIEHPIRVARIMVEVFGVTDPLVLVTLLLHDVLEDTDTSLEDIRAAFQKHDKKGRILRALELLTRPDAERIKKLPQLFQEIDYLQYVAGCLTAGDKILPDLELFNWLRIIVPLAKASDKIHNRRTLMGRRPKGRIEEICRNGNSLLMFMESSSLTKEHKLKILEEFNKSLLEIFSLMDLKTKDNQEKFLASFNVFLRRSIYEKLEGTNLSDKAGQKLDEFVDESHKIFEKTLEDPAKDINVRLVIFERQTLPEFLEEIQLNDNTAAEIMDEFSLFLFDVSEVSWLKCKRKILRFQEVIRRYREKIKAGDWEPKIPGIIEDLVRYSQADNDVLPPIIRSGAKSDIINLLSKVRFVNLLYERYLRNNKKRKELAAAILPRVAMLPLRHIYWLEDDEVKSIDRESVEDRIGGIAVTRQSDGRLFIRVQRSLSRTLSAFSTQLLQPR